MAIDSFLVLVIFFIEFTRSTPICCKGFSSALIEAATLGIERRLNPREGSSGSSGK